MAIKVLIVDDSRVFREILSRGIMVDPTITVVATAVDPYDAVDKILEFEPDVVTCDIEMPKMNGIEFIKRLMPQYPVPVIVVSAVSNKVFDAMNAGAVEFVSKPSAQSPESVQDFILAVINKIKAAFNATVIIDEKPINIEKNRHQVIKQFDLIGIGASTGGTEAIFKLLKQLPEELPGIVVVQHIPPIFSAMYAERLNQQTHFTVKEAANNDIIKRNHVYVAPGDQHVQVRKVDGTYVLRVFAGNKVSGHCPSVDVLFSSMAEEAKERAMGVLLTGMGYDGAKGITTMKRKGAITIGQDEASSVVYGMPKVAYELNGITKQTSLDLMGHYMMKYLR
ncbi:Chemotaxis response regulator protein-glutamate methylesterase 2 [Petrocella atlantisensis]|uniref:Protein-glutamate methylesterase/protein-glutamine glutaminase n=1 Tax=Petrocella atlantisensis TaxID=2173034 RepID=A0A3P7Q0S6_9FIRM|nr:chemotaxis-specific protein-glutamate methyltransferase CheB [Petrocella atlantisensis]VDN49001.1 Chemotaxis response regulator protein-glutamate methylesterase 2 [Petrocella atlantisensis]